MNEEPRRKLIELVAKYGRSLIENPRRLEGLLRDYCGEYRREISVLVMAVQEHAVLDMLAAASSQPRKVLLARLAQRLCDHLAISENAAVWSIESWALALNIISDAELSANETERARGQNNAERTENSSPAVGAGVSTQIVGTKPMAAVKPVSSTQKVFVVSASGGDFRTIMEALRNIPANSRILVQEGLYSESIVLDKNVEIIGDGAAGNIIVRSVNSSCISMQTGKAIVRNLTLQGRGATNKKAFFAVAVPEGELILESCDITSDSLSCIAVYGANAIPLIRKCRIRDGTDSGFYFFDNAGGRIEECDIYRNENVSVAIAQGATPTLKNCRIFEGNNGGVVVWGNGAAGLIEDCQISGHRLANVGIREYANPTFRRCRIFGGRDTGVFVQNNGYGTFEECDIYENAKAEVGISHGGNPTLRRCAIHGGETSGVVIQNRGRALIESCNIYDNAEAGVAVYGESEVAIRRCNIHRNRKVAVRIKEKSAASVRDSDLRGNFLAAWETDFGIRLEKSGNRES